MISFEEAYEAVAEEREQDALWPVVRWLPAVPSVGFAGVVLAGALVTLLGGCAIKHEDALAWCQDRGVGTSAQVEECARQWVEDTTPLGVASMAVNAASQVVAPAGADCVDVFYRSRGGRKLAVVCP